MTEEGSGHDPTTIEMRLAAIEDRLATLESAEVALRDFQIAQEYAIRRTHRTQPPGPPPPTYPGSEEPGSAYTGPVYPDPEKPVLDYVEAWLNSKCC